MMNYAAMQKLIKIMKGESDQYIERMLQKLMDFIPTQYDPLHPFSLTFEVNDDLSIMGEMDPDYFLEGSSFRVQLDLNGVLAFSEFKYMNKLFFTVFKKYLLNNGFSFNENTSVFSKNIL